MMTLNSFIAVLAVTLVFPAFALVEKKLFTLEKSYNPENILVIHTQVDESCTFGTSPSNEYVDFYWLMNGRERKEVHPTIRSQVKGRVSFDGINTKKDSFNVDLNDLKEISHDLESTTIEVRSSIEGNQCQVESLIKLGPSGNYRTLNLKRTYCEVKTNMLGIPSGCKFVDLEGVDADTGEAIKVRFKEKK